MTWCWWQASKVGCHLQELLVPWLTKDIGACDIQHFDDIKTSNAIPADGYYYRWETKIGGKRATFDMVCHIHLLLTLTTTPFQSCVNETCTCRQIYNPNIDNQRFCGGCSEWYHIQCLTETGPKASNSRCLPIVRGGDGKEDGEVKDWMIVGTGEVVKKSQRWAIGGSIVEDCPLTFSEMLMREKDWVWYHYPSCLHHI